MKTKNKKENVSNSKKELLLKTETSTYYEKKKWWLDKSSSPLTSSKLLEENKQMSKVKKVSVSAKVSHEHELLRSFISRLIERTKVDNKTGCWEFCGTVGNECGHTKITALQKKGQTHRIFFEWFNQVSLSPKEQVQHKCNNPPCYNPQHLKVGNSAENAADFKASGKPRKARADRLPDSLVRYIRTAVAGGVGIMELAEDLMVSRITIGSIANNKTYKKVV